MKSTFYIKLFLIFFLCTSLITVECFQDSRVKRVLHKSHKHKAQKATFQARFATFLNLGAQFEQRDKRVSMFDDVRPKINKAWQLLVADGTDYAAIDTLLAQIKGLYDAHLANPKNQNPQKQKDIKAEQNAFNGKFGYARKYDEQNEKYIVEKKQVEDKQVETEKDTRLKADQKKAQFETLERRKHELNQLILQGEGEIHRKLTDFINPVLDEATFKKNVVKAIESSMPDNFCYRKLSETSINFKCPDHHPHHNLALCYETCDQGQQRLRKRPEGKFKFVAGVCWEICDNTKQPKCEAHLLNVYPNGRSWTTLFDTHLRDSFIPDSLTHFNQDVTCPAGQEKWGALCYTHSKECSAYGYQRCGGAACALNSQECKDVIKDMVVSTITGLAKFSLLFVAPGAGQIIQLTSAVVSALSAFEGLISSMAKQRQAVLSVNNSQILRTRLIKDVVEYLQNKQQNVIGPAPLDATALTTRVDAILREQALKIQTARAPIVAAGAAIAGVFTGAKSTTTGSTGATATGAGSTGAFAGSTSTGAGAKTTATGSTGAGSTGAFAGSTATSTGAQTTTSVAVQENALEKVLKQQERVFQGLDMYSNARELYDASKEVATALKSASETTTVGEVVQEHFEDILKNLGSNESATAVLDSVVFDIQLAKNAYDLINECKKDISNMECKKALVGVAAVFDPTGLLGIAKAFMYNMCADAE